MLYISDVRAHTKLRLADVRVVALDLMPAGAVRIRPMLVGPDCEQMLVPHVGPKVGTRMKNDRATCLGAARDIQVNGVGRAKFRMRGSAAIEVGSNPL